MRAEPAGLIGDLRDLLHEAGFTESGLRELFGPDGSRRPALEFGRRDDDVRLHQFVRLFLFGLPVPRHSADRAFAPLPIESLSRVGLLEDAGEEIRASVTITPAEGLLIVHDHEHDGTMERPDHVLGVGPSTRAIAGYTPRAPVAATLDLGAGSGFQTLLAAVHSKRVVGTDINPRALNMAAFNVVLNGGFHHVELRHGDWFTPVADERFDLIVCNPPYVLSPDRRLIFRDAPMASLYGELLPAAAAHLEDDGIAIVMGNWGHSAEADWVVPIRQRTQGLPCDVLVQRISTMDPDSYSAAWNRGLRGVDLKEVLERWRSHFQDLGVEVITSGAVVLRRRDAPKHWFRHVDGTDGFVLRGKHLWRLVAAEDVMSAGDEALLDVVVRVPDDHRIVSAGVITSVGVRTDRVRLRLRGALRPYADIDASTLAILRRSDGTRSLRDVAEEISGGASGGGEVFGAVVGTARRLLAQGLLEVVTAS